MNQSNQRGNVVRVRDAFIEDITRDRNSAQVTISYGEMGDFNVLHMMVVVLIVGPTTVILNESGREIPLRDLRVGMTIDAQFSRAMTASQPPQARAYRITVVNHMDYEVKTDRIVLVDDRNNYFITGNPSDVNSQIRFNVFDETVILDRRGNRVCLCNLRPGLMVRVEHATYMTFSIPPQTTAFKVQVL